MKLTVSPGWSARINDPEVLAGLAKNRRAAKKFGAILVPLPLIGFAIYGAVSDKLELPKALLYGAIVSVVFLIFALIDFKVSVGEFAGFFGQLALIIGEPIVGGLLIIDIIVWLVNRKKQKITQ